MADEIVDEKIEEGNSEVPKTEENTEDKPVPYHRFKEVNDQLKELREMVKPKDNSAKTPEQEKEEKAKEYLKNLHKEVLAEEQKAKQIQEEKELKDFKEQLSEVLSVNTNVKRAEFEKFLETDGDDYSSIASAMKAFKRFNEIETKGKEKGKEEMKGKPKMPSHEGPQAEAPVEDKTKSIRQIAEEAIGSLEK